MKVGKEIKIEDKDGQAALSLVLLVGGTVVLIAATLLFLVLSFVNSTFGYQAANRAWGLVVSGLNDAILQISRNPTLGSQPYNLNLDNSVVKVEVKRGCTWDGESSQYCDASVRENQVLVTSEASVSGRWRRAVLYASVSEYGKVDIISITTDDGSGGSPI